jgi:hypothetical protein
MFTPPDVELLIEPLPPLKEPELLFALGAFFLRAVSKDICPFGVGGVTALGACGGAGGGGGGAGAAGSSLGIGAGSESFCLGALRLGDEHIILNPHYL